MSLNAFAASAVDVVGNEICGTRKSHIKGRELFMNKTEMLKYGSKNY